MIEIVMDDDESAGVVAVAAPNDGMVPVLPPPVPAPKGHSRGRSNGGEGGIANRISKATERLRSASRSRKESSRVKSPQMEAPYESVPTVQPTRYIKSPPLEIPQDTILTPQAYQLKSPGGSIAPPIMYDRDVVRSPIEPKGKHLSTGLHQSEMF
jgi:hypothetical protein